MAQLDETAILLQVYYAREGDNTGWAVTDSEYLTGRGYCNAAINRWETYDNTVWRELWTPSAGSTGGVLTTTAGTYAYACPTNMRYPASFVRTISNGISTYYIVLPPEKIAVKDDTTDKWVYFTGSIADGFTLHFNPDLTLTTGDTISYEYYKQATTFTAATSKSEMDDPYYIVEFVLSKFYEVDGEDGKSSKAWQIAEDKLETMRTRNMSGFQNIIDPIDDVMFNKGSNLGFGG